MKHLFSLCFIGWALISVSQEFDKGFEIKSKYGFLIAHRPIMNHLPEEHTKCIEATYFFQTRGGKDWHLAFKLPRIGVSLLYTSVGNKDVLGNYGGIYAFLQHPFLNRPKNRIYGKVGCGVGYTSTVFDQQTNPKNVAISSNVNALINFALLYEHHFKLAHLSFGLDMTHFSNGAEKQPNLGLNLPYICVGYGRFINKKDERLEIKSYTKPIYQKKPWSFSIIGITSFRDYSTLNNKPKQVLALNLATQKVFKLGVGYEVGFDFMYKPTIEYYKPNIFKPKESLFQFGIYNGYIMTMDKLQLIVGMGMYIKDEYFADDRFYHRVGMRYKIKDKLILNLTLKSHWAKADYLEYGIGYTL